MRKRWITALLALAMAIPIRALADNAAWNGFRGLSWGAFEEDIAEQEERLADSSRELGGLCLDLLYDGVSVSRFKNAQAAYILYDGELVCGGYAVTVTDEEDETYLSQALTELYGQPNADGRLIFRTIYGLLSQEDENASILETAPTAWHVDGTGILFYPEGDRLIILYIGMDYLNSMDVEDDAEAEAEELDTDGL